MRKIFMLILTLLTLPAYAGIGYCPDGHVLDGMLTRVAWNEMFPMRIFGVAKVGGDADKVPDSAYNGRICRCSNDSNIDIASKIGIPMGFWVPSYLLETTSEPFCVSSLAGTDLSRGSTSRGGTTINKESKSDNQHTDTFYHAHVVAFPILTMLDLFGDVNLSAASGSYTDMNIMFFSEMSPFWNDPELGMFSSPELFLVANPLAIMACGSESLKLFAGFKPINSLWWCSGADGGMMPATGFIRDMKSRVQAHSLAEMKMFNSLFRVGLVKNSAGKDAMCGGNYAPNVVKDANRFQHFFPYPQRKAHWPGDPAIKGRDDRVEPRHDTQIDLVWRWADICTGLYQ